MSLFEKLKKSFTTIYGILFWSMFAVCALFVIVFSLVAPSCSHQKPLAESSTLSAKEIIVASVRDKIISRKVTAQNFWQEIELADPNINDEYVSVKYFYGKKGDPIRVFVIFQKNIDAKAKEPSVLLLNGVTANGEIVSSADYKVGQKIISAIGIVHEIKEVNDQLVKLDPPFANIEVEDLMLFVESEQSEIFKFIVVN